MLRKQIKKNQRIALGLFLVTVVLTFVFCYIGYPGQVYTGNSKNPALVDAYGSNKLVVVQGTDVDALIESSDPFSLHENNRTITGTKHTPDPLGIATYYSIEVKNFTGTWTVDQTSSSGILIRATSSGPVAIHRSYTDAYYYGIVRIIIGIMAFLYILLLSIIVVARW